MIYGIGTDIVAVARLRRPLLRHGRRFVERILAPAEWPEYERTPHRERFLARRFAAKEAAVKAFGTGFADGIHACDISVTHDRAGRPMLAFAGAAAQRVVEANIARHHVSLTDEAEYAVAFVIFECP